ncbi:MAG TPA: helix-turn-helix domain-containing protein [Polyangiaceae bacterium]|jgi:AcrR family transcriptional regulator|nr:helix-turn-helix domain-containing protein [Polyangiaceae bacterium]
MPQVLKPEIRARILSAGLEVFAAQGYLGATMNAIAEQAGLGAASLYRYFPSKAELFEAAITPELAARFERLLQQRVRALGAQSTAAPSERIYDHGAEMLEFWLEHRLAVVVLLDRAQGSAYEHYGELFVSLLLESTLEQIRRDGSNVQVTPAARLVLTRIFENTRIMIATILAHSKNPRALREAIEAFWSYQIPGLHGFARWVRKE